MLTQVQIKGETPPPILASREPNSGLLLASFWVTGEPFYKFSSKRSGPVTAAVKTLKRK